MKGKNRLEKQASRAKVTFNAPIIQSVEITGADVHFAPSVRELFDCRFYNCRLFDCSGAEVTLLELATSLGGTLARVEREKPTLCACGSGLEARACQRTWRHCKLCTRTAQPDSEFCERHSGGMPVPEDYGTPRR